MTWTLVTIAFSHYCEKARWILERSGQPYVEHRYMPVLHFPGVLGSVGVRRLGRSDGESTRASTPALITGDAVVTDSAAIVDYVDRQCEGGGRLRLRRSAEATQLAAHFNGRFGADTRRMAYFYILPDARLVATMARRNVGPTQARLFIAGRWPITQILRRHLGINADSCRRSRDRVLAEFDAIDARLADGRPYLCGDAFSAADLSFAALGGAGMLVNEGEGYGAWLPELDEVDGELGRFARELRERPAGRFILRMYADERRPA